MQYECEFYEDTYDELSEEEQEFLKIIDSFCLKMNMKWRYLPSGNFTYFYTQISTWRVDFRENTFVLYHKNSLGNPGKKCMEGFHKQNKTFSNIKKAIYYIFYHDKRKYMVRKKGKIIWIFFIISKEYDFIIFL